MKINNLVLFLIIVASIKLLAMESSAPNITEHSQAPQQQQMSDNQNITEKFVIDDDYPPDCCITEGNSCYCDCKICFQKSKKACSRFIRSIKKFINCCSNDSLAATDDFCDNC